MAQDYAKKKSPRGGGASRAPRRKKAPAKPKFSKVMLGSGLASLVLIGFLVYVATRPGAATSPATAADPGLQSIVKEATTAKDRDRKPADSAKDTEYDFYRLLAEQEVDVAAETQAARPRTESPVSKPASTTDARSLLLQAGSFRKAADADRRRAQLILNGMPAEVQTVTLESGDIWHRVHVGPYEDQRQLAAAREVLQRNGIETLLLKRKS